MGEGIGGENRSRGWVENESPRDGKWVVVQPEGGQSPKSNCSTRENVIS